MKLTTALGEYDVHGCFGDWGTERRVVVRTHTGMAIGDADPFWPSGIPTTLPARQKRIRSVARRLIREYERSLG